MPSVARRALLVAPTAELAATLGVSFDNAQAATPDQVGLALGATAPEVDCVAVTGVEDLSGVAAAVRAYGAPEVSLVIDVSGRQGADVFARGGAALTGFELQDTIKLGDVPCLRLRIADDPASIPRLPAIDGHLAAGVGAGPDERRDVAAEALATQVRAERLQRRVAELEAELATREGAATIQTSESAPAAAKPKRVATALAIGGALAVAVSILLAVVTSTGYGGALLTGLAILVIVNLLYAWRSNRRRAAADRTARKAATRSDAASARQAADRHRELMKALADLADGEREVLQAVALLAASTTYAASDASPNRSPSYVSTDTADVPGHRRS
ncbi:hypothetical protein [uncultured Jatrophihabitans sp.]|uniref:hypothetical protein n=1 Tax=uncultured Jatrophihabitans sp. TaxID=1610747 RepID=UPI0035CBEC23